MDEKYLLDLRDNASGRIRIQAMALVYAVMLHPRNRRNRKQAMKLISTEDRTKAEVGRALERAKSNNHASISGHMLVRLIQMKREDWTPSLNAASFMLSQRWQDDWLSDEEMRPLRGRGTGKHRERHLKIWREYRPVAHFWGAYVLSHYQNSNAPKLLEGNFDLVRFVHVADDLAMCGSTILLDNRRRRRREPAMVKEKTWRVHLPASCRPARGWYANIPPLTQDELSDLSSHRIARRPKS